MTAISKSENLPVNKDVRPIPLSEIEIAEANRKSIFLHIYGGNEQEWQETCEARLFATVRCLVRENAKLRDSQKCPITTKRSSGEP